MQPSQPNLRPARHLLWIILAACLQVLAACGLPLAAFTSTPPAAPQTSATVPTVTTPAPTIATIERPIPAEPVATLSPTRPLPQASNTLDCRLTSPNVDDLLLGTDETAWLGWVRKLSGAEPVTVRGQTITFTTRSTTSMFADSETPSAFDFVHDTVLTWYPEEQVEVQNFSEPHASGAMVQGKNLILTYPGTAFPDEIVILSAHLDSTNRDGPSQPAPGAEDNASGSAALLEAARLFHGLRFERTLQIVWFTGEEQGLLGSKAFVDRLDDSKTVQGVINLDMFGYDSDNDRCFELHVGTLPASNKVGTCFIQSIEAYRLDLPRYDYLTQGATGSSDHSRFWDSGIGAVEVLENHFNNGLTEGCSNADGSPYYHSANDTADRLNPTTASQIVRAALATTASMAGVLE